MLLVKPNSKIRYRNEGQGWECSDDGGETWCFTFRCREEILAMHPSIVDTTPDTEAAADADRELFGETLDEPIPDDMAEMLGIV
jgi:hypothetical protein